MYRFRQRRYTWSCVVALGRYSVVVHAWSFVVVCLLDRPAFRDASLISDTGGGGGGGFRSVRFPGKKRYEGVRFNVISVTREWVGVQFPGKSVTQHLNGPQPK